MRHDDLEEEIRSHLEEKTDELVASGMSRADAERSVRRAFGDVTRVKERAGDVWRFASILETVARDVRYALRGLCRNPGFTIAVVLTLALGIGANGVMFALVNAVVLRPLPYPHSDRLISVSQSEDGRDTRQLWDFAYAEWLRSSRSVEATAAYEDTRAVLTSPDGPTRIDGLRATHAYFTILGVQPLLGRLPDSTEALPGAPRVVLLSELLWRDKFGADSATVGRSASFDGVPRLVIGVLPASFTRGRTEQFWIPLRAEPRTSAPPQQGELLGYYVLARLRAGASLAGVRAELTGAFARFARGNADEPRSTPVVMSLHERRHGESRRPLLLLLGAVGVLLLTACANIGQPVAGPRRPAQA
ncbi:MAG: ABC transporter permease [Pseudomonas sp.]